MVVREYRGPASVKDKGDDREKSCGGHPLDREHVRFDGVAGLECRTVGLVGHNTSNLSTTPKISS